MEFFGPVFALYKVSSEGEAIALANDIDYGLGAHVFAGDDTQGEKIALEL